MEDDMDVGVRADDGDGGDDGHESLAEFLASGDHGSPDESEEDDGPPAKGAKAKQEESHSDEEDDSDDEPQDRRAESHSRMVRKLAERERQLTEHRAQVKESQRRIQELESRLSQQDPDDDLLLLRNRAARRLGVQANDPKVNEYLFELSRDLTFDHLGDAVDLEPDLKKVRDQRREERKRQEERRTLEGRIERMEREKVEAEQRAQKANAQAAIGQFLTQNSEQHPFLMAQTDVDPIETVTDLAFEAIRTGQVQLTPGDDAAANRLLITIAKNLDAHYRKLAEVLSKKLRPAVETADDDIDVRTERAGKAKKQTQTKRTGTTGTGGGGRGRPTGPTRDEDGDEDFATFMRKELRREESLKRGRR